MLFLRKTASKAVNEKYAYALAITGITVAFFTWASLFIYRSSFVAIDGRRYFALFDDAMISMRYAWNPRTASGWSGTRASTSRATPIP